MRYSIETLRARIPLAVSAVSSEQVFYPVASLADALASGVPVLTPNHRLARRIRVAWGQLQRQRNHVAWETPRVMSLDHWWSRCYQSARQQGSELPGVATTTQQRALWRQVVQEDASAAGLLTTVSAGRFWTRKPMPSGTTL